MSWVQFLICHLCDKTTSGNEPMEEGIIWVHGFRRCGPMLLDLMLLGKIAEEETYRRNLHFWMDKKQTVRPTGSRDNMTSRACCQEPTSTCWPSPPKAPSASRLSTISYQSACACHTTTMIVPKCSRHYSRDVQPAVDTQHCLAIPRGHHTGERSTWLPD